MEDFMNKTAYYSSSSSLSLSTFSLTSSPYNDNNYSANNYSRCISYISSEDPYVNWTGVVLAFIGYILNILILVVLSQLKRMRRSTRLLLGAIAISDMLYFTFALPQKELKKILDHGDQCKVIIALSKLQNVLFYLHHSNQMIKVWNVVILAMERYICLYHPFRVNHYFQVRRIMLAFLVLLLLSLITAAPHLIQFEIVVLEETGQDSRCQRILYCKPYWLYWKLIYLWYNAVLESSLKFFLPLSSLLYLTVRLIYGTSLQSRKQKTISPSFCNVEEELETNEKINLDKLQCRRDSKKIVITVISRMTSRIYRRRWTMNITCSFIFVFFLLSRSPIMLFNFSAFVNYGSDKKPVDSEHLKDTNGDWLTFATLADICYGLDSSIFPFLTLLIFNSSFREQLFALSPTNKKKRTSSIRW